MKTHITTLNNMAGTASLAHRRVLKVAQSIGCHEMGLSFYPLKPDYAKEIDKRLDGIIAPLNYGDIVIFQYPSWIGVNYDESFVNKIKSYRDTKLIIFVQDIQKLMFDSEQAILDMEIRTLNKADLLILPSKKMHRYLKENGLDEKPVIYQTIWDMPSDICFVDHAVTRCFHFAGNYNRFPFLAEYHGKTPIYQYDANKPDRENDDSFCRTEMLIGEEVLHCRSHSLLILAACIHILVYKAVSHNHQINTIANTLCLQRGNLSILAVILRLVSVRCYRSCIQRLYFAFFNYKHFFG